VGRDVPALCDEARVNLWTEVLPTGSIGGAAVAILMAVERWIRRKRFRARVVRGLEKPDASALDAFGSMGWLYSEMKSANEKTTAALREEIAVLRDELSKARSKGHSNERWCADNAQRLASCETELFGASRMQSGEQERIDWARERRSFPLLAPADDSTTEPDPLPPMRDEPMRLPSPGSGRDVGGRRRSRP
jgi:hypothetical protein